MRSYSQIRLTDHVAASRPLPYRYSTVAIEEPTRCAVRTIDTGYTRHPLSVSHGRARGTKF